jgi:hypothetical protein
MIAPTARPAINRTCHVPQADLAIALTSAA